MALSLEAQKSLEVPDCLFCCESLLENPPLSVSIPCGHVFHHSCMEKNWKKIYFTYDEWGTPYQMPTENCPTCRE